MDDPTTSSRAAADGGEPKDSSIFVAAFLGLLVFACIAQLLAMPWRSWLPGAESEKSMIRGVSAAVYSFMSHIP